MKRKSQRQTNPEPNPVQEGRKTRTERKKGGERKKERGPEDG